MKEIRIVKIEKYDKGLLIETKFHIQYWKKYWFSVFNKWETIGYSDYSGDSDTWYETEAIYNTLEEAETVLANLKSGIPFYGNIKKPILNNNKI